MYAEETAAVARQSLLLTTILSRTRVGTVSTGDDRRTLEAFDIVAPHGLHR